MRDPDPRIESYLNRVAEHLRTVPEDERSLILQSIEDHIRDALSEQAASLPHEQAVAVVLASLSPPESYEPAGAAPHAVESLSVFSIAHCALTNHHRIFALTDTSAALGRLSAKMLLVFVASAGLYGGVMGSFRALHPEFRFTDFELTAGGKTTPGKVAGIDARAGRVYVRAGLPTVVNGATVRFNRSNPTEPYAVRSVGREEGFDYLAIEPDTPLHEENVWGLPLLTALKVPLLFLLTLATCALALYALNLALGLRLAFLPGMALMTFALAATGVVLAVFAPIAALFSITTANYHFIKVFHVIVFAVAGLFGTRVLYRGLCYLASPGTRVRAILATWLIVYALVGGQIAWTLKPYLGTPYIPATPPWRPEAGNIYVNFLDSLKTMRAK